MMSAFEAIERATTSQVAVEEGDYIKDGLLHCGKCNTPKQARVVLFGEVRTSYCLCKCATEKVQAKKEEEKRREFDEKVKRLRKMGFPEAQMEGWTFELDDQPDSRYSQIAKRYVDNFQRMRSDGRGLLLFGDVGVGKTFIAACIINALIDKGVPCMMTSFGRITNTLSGMFEGKQEYIDQMSDFTLLAIDDLGTERDTEYVGEIVYNIIDNRYREGLPLIVTTNLSAQDLKSPTDIRKKRVYSRLLEMCIPIEVKGTDRRKQKLKNTYADYKDILGL